MESDETPMKRNLVERCTEAGIWIDKVTDRYLKGGIFARVAGSVVWSDAKGPDGELLLAIDPKALVERINAEPFPLLHEHDPGRPMGKVLAAQEFETDQGEAFVAAVLGLYGRSHVGFGDLGLDLAVPATAPRGLPSLPVGLGMDVAADPREVDPNWLDALASSAPVPVVRRELSHNAATPTRTLVVLGVAFATLVWNPFVTTVATEAGKDAYAAARDGLSHMLAGLSELENPAIEIQSFQHGCHVSFMLRGRDRARHMKAQESLPEAAARAAELIDKMLASDLGPVRLVYEYDHSTQRWYPSFAELSDGRLVSDDAELIAAENLPTGLSLGLHVDRDDEPRPIIPRW